MIESEVLSGSIPIEREQPQSLSCIMVDGRPCCDDTGFRYGAGPRDRENGRMIREWTGKEFNAHAEESILAALIEAFIAAPPSDETGYRNLLRAHPRTGGGFTPKPI